jgi:hypothetical protein
MFGLEKKRKENCVAKRFTTFTINRILRVLIKMDDIGWPCSVHGSVEKYIRNFVWKTDPSIHLWHYSPFRALAALIRRLHWSLFSALLLHPLIPSIREHSMYQKSIPFPCSQVVVYLLNPSEASLRFSQQRLFYRVGSLPPTPNPQPGGPRCPFLFGSSPLTCLAWVTLPVAMLPPA